MKNRNEAADEEYQAPWLVDSKKFQDAFLDELEKERGKNGK